MLGTNTKIVNVCILYLGHSSIIAVTPRHFFGYIILQMFGGVGVVIRYIIDNSQ